MRTKAAFCYTLGVLFTSLGMTGEGCFQISDLPGIERPPPVIIPANPGDPTFDRTFSVDLRDYPETERISWEFGDGGTALNLPVSTGKTVSHAYQASGTFEVAVHLFSPRELSTGRSKLLGSGWLPVTVTGPNVPPIASFVVAEAPEDDNGPQPLRKRFDGTRSRDPDGTIVAWTWDFGDGSSDTGQIVEHTFAFAAQFEVRLTVVDDRGGSGTTTKPVLANTRPTASFTYTQDPQDALTYTFDGSASSDPEGPIVNYRWNFGDDTAEQTGKIVTHTYAVPDDYTVVLTVTDDTGAVGSTSQVLDVTGTEPFVRSVTPPLGQTGETLSDLLIDGENFETGATVRFERGSTVINGADVNVQSATSISLSLDLAGAETGSYNVTVTNPGGASAQKIDAFTVVTPNLVRLTTSLGDILLELVDDAPITTANFLQYVEDGFYDGTIFHRVVPDFVVQGGGFLPGMIEQEGVRDPIKNEFSPDRSNIRATVAMAKVGGDPDSATSEFFVNLADNSENLDNQNGGFTVFANVIEGMDVVDAIAAVPLDGEQPVTDVLLITARRE